MDLLDKMSKQPLGGLKLPKLKGHAKITVTNADGSIAQQVEADNVVTNAVRDIVANDYLGALDPNAMTPLWKKWYGGIRLYGTAHQNLDPDDYYIRNDYSQYCIAHAGHDNPDDLADDYARGFYDTSSEVKTKNSVKQVWTWGPDAGYLNVSALSLCNESLGNAGTGHTQDGHVTEAFKNFFPFEILSTRIPNFTANMKADNNIIAMLDNSHGIWFEMGQYGEYANMNSRFETHYLTVFIKKLAFREAGLYDCDDVNHDFIEHFTIDLGGNIYCQPAYAFVDGYLWIFSNITGIGGTGDGDDLTYDTANMNWWKINMSTKTLDSYGTWYNSQYANNPLGPCCIEARGWYNALAPVSVGTRSIFTNIPYVKDVVGQFQFYFPVCDGPVSHATAPAFNVIGVIAMAPIWGGVATYYYSYDDKQYEFMNSMSSDTYPSIAVMPGRVQNQGKFFTCQSDPLWVDNRNVYITQACSWAFTTPYKPSSYVVPIGTAFDWNAPRYLVANKFLNTTKLNLQQPVQKTNTQHLTIEYTLTQI